MKELGVWFYGLLAFIGGCSFGILSTFVKIAYSQGFHSGQVIGAQFFTGAMMLLVIYLFRKKQRLTKQTVIRLIISGFPMALSGIFYYQSLRYLDASIAIIMLFQFSWMGIIAEWMIDRVRPNRAKVIAVFILFFGSLLGANIFSSSLGSLSLVGVGWGLLAATAFTTFIFVSGRVETHVEPLTKSLIMSMGAVIVAFTLFTPSFLVDGTYFNKGLIYYGLLLGLFGVVLPPLLFSISMPKIGSGLGTIITSSELPTAVIMSMLVLKEYVNLLQWLGVLLVLFGIAIPTLRDVVYQKRFQKREQASGE